jgi:Tn3 transposase DDE domain
VWNTIKIGNIVGQLRAAGEQIDDADLSRVSPLAHRHVIPNGTYFLNQAVGDPKE